MQSIYILDTSILYQLCKVHAALPGDTTARDDWKGRLAERVLATESLVVPESVLIEILGQLLHERIGGFSTADLGRDDLPHEQGGYRDYLQWYRQQQIVANRFIYPLLDSRANVELWRRTEDPQYEALKLSYDWLPPRLFRDLIAYYQDRLRNRQIELREREPKCLDGMDGRILFDAIQIARTKRTSKCIFLTEDQVLRHVVKDIRRRAAERGNPMPTNLFAATLSEYQRQHRPARSR